MKRRTLLKGLTAVPVVAVTGLAVAKEAAYPGFRDIGDMGEVPSDASFGRVETTSVFREPGDTKYAVVNRDRSLRWWSEEHEKTMSELDSSRPDLQELVSKYLERKDVAETMMESNAFLKSLK